jgi:hypothetical protein
MSTTEKTATTEETATAEKTANITVIQAVYGATQGQKDVTAKVQDLVNRGTTTFVANNATFGDPAQGHDKHFAMNYTISSTRFAFACKENETVRLKTTVPQGRFQVIGASYGAINPSSPTSGARDVTAVLQEVLDSSSATEIKFKPTNKFLGDPYDGPRKNFGMTYVLRSNPTQRKVVVSDQDQDVIIK